MGNSNMSPLFWLLHHGLILQVYLKIIKKASLNLACNLSRRLLEDLCLP